MKPRVLAVLGAIVLVLGCAGGYAWWSRAAAPGYALGSGSEAGLVDIDAGEIPIPPFPPRIAEGDEYDKCLTMLTDDPEGAEAIAESWQAKGGGDGALHCQALALIAAGEPDDGAAMLEDLAHSGRFAGLARAVLLGQAAEARLMAEKPDLALRDTTEALAISPDDPDLLIGRATAEDALDKTAEALDDLNQALSLDDGRIEAFTLRASIWRRKDMLDEARSDIEKAVALDPDDAEALLERGILRQRTGDAAGARADWTHARDVDPNSEAAELAEQNLTLLDSGPDKK